MLIPCTTVTGNAIEGATIGVSGTGKVFFASIEQFPDGVRTIVDSSVIARSDDRGKSWRNIVPGGGPISPHGSLSTWLRYEHSTERLWYASPTAPCGGTVSWSDDEGASWRTVPNIGCPAQGGIGMIEGPAPPGTPQPTGYPNVVYYCANSQDGEESVLACHRSRDGGATWSFIRSTPDPVPAESGCPPTRLRTTRVGDVGPDGILHFPTFSCDDETLGLAVSADQGETWERRAIAEIEIQDLYPPALAIDSRARIYIALKGPAGLPHLVVSRDRGTSWSKPMMVAPPGLDEMRRRVGITARGPGDIVLSYLGTDDGGPSYDAYVTESRNAAQPRPTFHSAVANDPAQSVVAGDADETFADRIQLLRPDIADDGTSWAAFHCFETSLCPGERLGLATMLKPLATRPCSLPQRGGDGRDTPRTLPPTDAGDAIRGRGGNDRLRGGRGADCLHGQKGSDWLSGDPGADRLHGGPGTDVLHGRQGGDELRGGRRADVLRGHRGPDEIRGGRGHDRLRGGNGRDLIRGERGNDWIGAVDGRRDVVRCGRGRKDVAVVDRRDKVAPNCEDVRVRKPG